MPTAPHPRSAQQRLCWYRSAGELHLVHVLVQLVVVDEDVLAEVVRCGIPAVEACVARHAELLLLDVELLVLGADVEGLNVAGRGI